MSIVERHLGSKKPSFASRGKTEYAANTVSTSPTPRHLHRPPGDPVHPEYPLSFQLTYRKLQQGGCAAKGDINHDCEFDNGDIAIAVEIFNFWTGPDPADSASYFNELIRKSGVSDYTDSMLRGLDPRGLYWCRIDPTDALNGAFYLPRADTSVCPALNSPQFPLENRPGTLQDITLMRHVYADVSFFLDSVQVIPPSAGNLNLTLVVTLSDATGVTSLTDARAKVWAHVTGPHASVASSLYTEQQLLDSSTW